MVSSQDTDHAPTPESELIFERHDVRGFLSLSGFLISCLSLFVAYRSYINGLPVSSTEIREVIDKEAMVATTHDLNLAREIFVPNATIRDVSSNPSTSWSGIENIIDRYKHLGNFSKLKHIQLTIDFDMSKEFARVKGSTDGSILNSSGIETDISNVNGEEWTLEKVGGHWKILHFTFGIQAHS